MMRYLKQAAALALLAFAVPASGQEYPRKPVSLIIGYPPSGVIDVVLRIALPKLSAALGQPVLMVNRPGAGGSIATDFVIRSPADGYTLLVNGDQLVTTPHLFGATVKYDLFRELAPVTRLVTVPFALVVNNDVPAHSLAELGPVSRSKAGGLSYGTPGNGTGNHLSMEWFKSIAGINALHVPYKGANTVMNDLVAGRIDATLISIQLSAPFVKSGKLRALATSGSSRAPQIPMAPTFAEAGYTEFEAGTTFGLLAPAATPVTIIQRLNAEFGNALRAPDVRKVVDETGTIITADTPSEFAKKLRDDYERYGRIIRENRISLE